MSTVCVTECKRATFLNHRVHQVPATWKSAGHSGSNLVLSKCERCVTNQEAKLRNFVSRLDTEFIFQSSIWKSIVSVELSTKTIVGNIRELSNSPSHVLWLRCIHWGRGYGHSIYLLGGHNCRTFGAFWPKRYFFWTHSLQKYCKTYKNISWAPVKKYFFEQSLPPETGPLSLAAVRAGWWYCRTLRKFSRGSTGHRASWR